MIKVLAKHPGHPAHFVSIPNTLEAMQSLVGGYIETVTLAPDLVLICNEEGFLRHLPDNCQLCGMRLVGSILLAGIDGEEFTDVPLDRDSGPKMFPELFAREVE